MIVCTGCGAKNEDAARACLACGRKLQSLRTARAAEEGGEAREHHWRALSLLTRTHADEAAAKLVRVCAETWAYALVLLLGAGLTMATESWWWLGAGVLVAGGLAWLRGI